MGHDGTNMKMNGKTRRALYIEGYSSLLMSKLDNTVTKMGHRALLAELQGPTTDISRVQTRHQSLKLLDSKSSKQLSEILKNIPDLDKILRCIEDIREDADYWKNAIDTVAGVRGRVSSSGLTGDGPLSVEWATSHAGSLADSSAVERGSKDKESAAEHPDYQCLGTSRSVISQYITEQASGQCGIAMYRRCLQTIRDIQTTVRQLHALTAADCQFPLQSELQELFLSLQPFRAGLDGIVQYSDDGTVPTPLLFDGLVGVVRDRVDEYLDLARRVYSQNIREAQFHMLQTEQALGATIHRDQIHGLCFKIQHRPASIQTATTLSSQAIPSSQIICNREPSPLNTSQRRSPSASNGHNYSAAPSSSGTCEREGDGAIISSNSENAVIEENSESEYRGTDSGDATGDRGSIKKHSSDSRSGSTDSRGDSSSSAEHVSNTSNTRVIILRSNSQYKLVTTEELQMLNYKATEALTQAIELAGKTAMRFLRREESVLSRAIPLASSLIAELDILVSISIYRDTYPTVTPVYADRIEIERLGFPPIKSFKPSDYSLSVTSFNLIIGKNMSGKSTYAKNLAITLIMAQMGYPIVGRRASLSMITQILYVDCAEDINQVLEVCSGSAVSRVLVIVDELSVAPAVHLAFSELLISKRILTFFISHDLEMLRHIRQRQTVNVLRFAEYEAVVDAHEEAYSEQPSCQSAREICARYLPGGLMGLFDRY